ncbi:uncharacterized protein LOC122068081 [Macadamia integrifolia]|uniref:uncharacterized protein LOC122068081 n=1 Tax=Macadamia integrifolia TaxID=60698 RepID=UPI001C4FAA78|nr:uncharacterized protein LOC122068081 [Macadamia integrifolia]
MAVIILIPYHIWSARNKRKYECLERNHSFVVKAVLRDLIDFSKLVPINIKSVSELVFSRQLKVLISPSTTRKIVKVPWQCLPLVYWKLNIDGCSLGNPGCSGAGGILHDDQGIPSRLFANYEGISSNFVAGFIAFFAGINHTRSMNIRKPWIECDSMAVVMCIKNKKNSMDVSAGLVVLRAT